MLGILFAILAVFGAAFLGRWAVQLRRGEQPFEKPTATETGIGFGTNFFDTLGIGSFAPTTSLFKLLGIVPDERIPGTLNVGHTPPVIVQAFIFFTIVQVDVLTLVTWIGAAVLGAWLGAGVVARLPRRHIQIGMGIALLTAAASLVLSMVGFAPIGGEARGLGGAALVVAGAVSFVLGSLMTIGVGIYAPTMIMVTMMGMNPVTAFPLMMGAAAFLMPVASFRFLAAKRYAVGAAIGLAVGGIPAVLIAAFIVRSLPLGVLRGLVVVVVLYTAIAMLRSAAVEAKAPAPAPAEPVGQPEG